MKIDKGIRDRVQAQLAERGFPDPIPEPSQPEWDGFRERLKAAHPDLYEQLLSGLRYQQFPDPQTQQTRQAQKRKVKARRKAALTQELDELTGQVVTSRPKLLLWGGLALLGFAALVAWGVSLSMPPRQAANPSTKVAASVPRVLEPPPPAIPEAKPIPKPPTTPRTPTKPLPSPIPAPENWTPPTPTRIPSTPQPIALRQPEPLPQALYAPPPPPLSLETARYIPPSPPKSAITFKAGKPPAAPDSPEQFSLFNPEETPTENLATPETDSEPGSFYLASRASNNPTAAPLVVGQFYQGQLASDLILTEGGKMTAVVLSGTSVWQGEASLGVSKRIELRFSQLSLGGQSHALSAVGYGLEGGRRVPGLSAQFRDQAPALAADALRGALRGVARYVDLSNQGGSSTVSGGVVLQQPNPPDLLANVAGSLAELLAVPAGERALVRIAAVPQGTPVQLLVLSLGEPSR